MATDLEIISACLDEAGFSHSVDVENGRVMARFLGAKTNAKLFAHLWTDDSMKLLLCTVFLPCSAPVALRPRIAELIVRANLGLKFGRFEMDFDDGELSFNHSALHTDELSAQIVQSVLLSSLYLADKYTPAFMQCLFSDEAPDIAISGVEMNLPDGDTEDEDDDN